MKYDRIQLAHGGGGRLSNELVEEILLPIIGNPILDKLNDQGIFSVNSSRFALTTDSYVINPIFFPGGDIGELAVYGTVNDLAMGGARPLYLSLGLIIEEGFPLADLKKIMHSIKKAADRSDVRIVTGDTKVVNKGCADGIFINTSGIGVVENDRYLSADNLKIGDKVLVSGYIGDHGIAIMSVREGLVFQNPVQSDSAPLNKLVESVLETNAELHAMRDPTRGGVASTLNEFAARSGVGILLEEDQVPIRPEVVEACDILGLDPLYVANEGKAVIIAAAGDAEKVLQAMKADPLGAMSRVIGEVTEMHPGKVLMRTRQGTTRVVDMLSGEQLPRIC
jgi:hydrogenase expression/formation protein HypE